MKYVYLVYDESHGLLHIRGNRESANYDVKYIATHWYDLDIEHEPLDYDSEDHWGWDGIAYWQRMEVKE